MRCFWLSKAKRLRNVKRFRTFSFQHNSKAVSKVNQQNQLKEFCFLISVKWCQSHHKHISDFLLLLLLADFATCSKVLIGVSNCIQLILSFWNQFLSLVELPKYQNNKIAASSGNLLIGWTVISAANSGVWQRVRNHIGHEVRWILANIFLLVSSSKPVVFLQFRLVMLFKYRSFFIIFLVCNRLLRMSCFAFIMVNKSSKLLSLLVKILFCVNFLSSFLWFVR